MPISCLPFAEVNLSIRRRLDQSLVTYYQAAPQNYYPTADLNLEAYNERTLPFHMDLLKWVSHGTRVCEVGCGTAHFCPQVEGRGGHYTGLDWSEKLLEKNARRFPDAAFVSAISEVSTEFDLVVSLYTLEHVSDPLFYLSRLWKLCRAGGLVAIICPDFVDGEGLPPSFIYGATPRRLRNKLKRGALRDAIRHILDLKFSAPIWKMRARRSPAGAFWINLRPKALEDPDYSIDADAVHLSRLKDIVWWLEAQKADVIARSDRMNAPATVLKHNCYVAARKPRISA